MTCTIRVLYFLRVPIIFNLSEELPETTALHQHFYILFKLSAKFSRMTIIIVEIPEFGVISVPRVIYQFIKPLNVILSFHMLHHLGGRDNQSMSLKGIENFLSSSVSFSW